MQRLADNHPYSKLIVYGKPERPQLAELLEGRVLIYEDEANRIEIVSSKAPAHHQILLYLLARRVLTHTEYFKSRSEEAAAPREIEAALDMSGGTIRPNLTRLASQRLIEHTSDGYRVNTSKLHEIEQELERRRNQRRE